MAGSDIAARATTGARPAEGIAGSAAISSAALQEAKENVTVDSEREKMLG